MSYIKNIKLWLYYREGDPLTLPPKPKVYCLNYAQDLRLQFNMVFEEYDARELAIAQRLKEIEATAQVHIIDDGKQELVHKMFAELIAEIEGKQWLVQNVK